MLTGFNLLIPFMLFMIQSPEEQPDIIFNLQYNNNNNNLLLNKINKIKEILN